MRPASTPDSLSDLRIGQRTQAVLDYEQVPGSPGRPLYLLLGGGSVAVLSMIFMGLLAHHAWMQGEIGTDRAYFGISLLFCFYVLGIFLFAYAYELYDMPRALRLTIFAVVISLLGLVLIIGSMTVVARLKGLTGAAKKGNAITDGSVISAVLSMRGSAGEEEPEQNGFEPFITGDARPFEIDCGGCGASFSPAPPRAACPYCGREALAG